MSGLLKHVFASVVADSVTATEIQPQRDWNDYHVFSGGNSGSLLLRDTSDATYGGAWLASVATGSVLVSGGAGSAPAWSGTPTLTGLTLNGSGRLSVQASATGIAIDITGRAGDHAGYLQLFKNDGTTLEGGFRGGTGFVAFFGPAGADVLTITNPGMACAGTVSGTDFTSSGANGYQVAAGAFVFWTGRSSFNAPGASQINMTNAAASVGVGFDVATPNVLKIRTLAQSAYAQIDALGHSTGGVAGVTTFGPAAVVSITVKGGIITAIS